MNAPTIRRAGLPEVAILAQLRVRFLRELDLLTRAQEPALIQATEEYLRKALPAGEFVAFVAEVDGQVVGTGSLLPSQRPPAMDNLSGREGYVLNMWTEPAYRRRGIAAALLREIVAHARNARIGRLRLHATDDGRSLYEQFGFQGRNSEMVLKIG